MSVNKDVLKTLREKSGCGMMECKQAMFEACEDIEKALEILRKKGIAKAVKKETRTTKDGLVGTAISEDGKSGVMVEVACETDFVAKTDAFILLVNNIVSEVNKAGNISRVQDMPDNIKNMVIEAIGRLGENIKVSKLARFDMKAQKGLVIFYRHPGDKLGVMLEVKCDKEGVKELQLMLKDVAMQVAAMNPSWIKPEDIPQEVMLKEKEVYVQQEKDSGKPDKIIEQIAAGRLKKFYSQVCLLDQEFIKNPKIKVRDIIADIKVKTGVSIEISRFARFKVGEE